jgi:hypothetical protein
VTPLDDINRYRDNVRSEFYIDFNTQRLSSAASILTKPNAHISVGICDAR